MWVVVAWSAAGAIAVLLLGFCAYEITWKANRLRRDTGKLQAASDQLAALRSQLAEAQQRAAAARQR
jgi:outer membrane murein-binding lipoprotein Lpp